MRVERGALRRVVVGALAVVVGLPVVLALVVGAWLSLADETNGTIPSSGETREYLLYLPKTYDPARATPLVISLHALAMWPSAGRSDHARDRRDRGDVGVVRPAPIGPGRRVKS